MSDLTELGIKEASKALSDKEFSSIDLTKAYLGAIKEKDKDINAYLEVFEDEVLEKAAEADKSYLDSGAREILSGIPLAIKDNILIKGRRCTAASKLLATRPVSSPLSPDQGRSIAEGPWAVRRSPCGPRSTRHTGTRKAGRRTGAGDSYGESVSARDHPNRGPPSTRHPDSENR